VPEEIAICDLNRDAAPDLVVVDSAAGAIEVFLNLSLTIPLEPVTFGPHGEHDVGAGAQGIASGDVDRNGCDDVVTANPGAGSVSLLLGNGGGGFAPATHFAAGEGARAVAIGDFDRDGRPDLVMTSGDSVAVFRGDGLGGFGAGSRFATGGTPQSVAAGDLNRDGRLDIATANGSGLSVLLGDGAAGFGAPLNLSMGWALEVAIADANRDGIPDLVAAGYDFVAAFVGHGDGTFELRWIYGGPLYGWVVSFALGDVNRDGRLDLACVGHLGYHAWWGLQVFLGNGDGSFSAGPGYFGNQEPALVAMADFNVDAKQDLLVNVSGGVQLMLGDGHGEFAPHMTLNTGAGGVAISDLNRDGSQDLALTSSDGTVSVFLNRSLTVPAAVEYLEAVAGEGRVQLSWGLSAEAQRDLSGVRVQRASTPEGPYSECAPSPLEPAHRMSFDDVETPSAGTYWYRLVLLLGNGSEFVVGPVSIELASEPPSRTALRQPFEPRDGGWIVIRYSIGAARAPVRLAIFDVRGREVRRFAPGVGVAGEHSQAWDRRSQSGTRVSRGIYFVHLEVGTVTASRKLMLVHR
jgi:hypothetical protein